MSILRGVCGVCVLNLRGFLLNFLLSELLEVLVHLVAPSNLRCVLGELQQHKNDSQKLWEGTKLSGNIFEASQSATEKISLIFFLRNTALISG